MIKVIGIDPGLAETGVGIVTGSGVKVTDYAYGVIRTDKALPVPERLEILYSRLREILQKESPQLMVVEDIFSLHRYPKSGIVLGKVTGVILLAGFRSGVSVKEIPVREAKQVLTGNGNASKLQLEVSVRSHLRRDTPIRPYHVSDALGLALIGLFRYAQWLQGAYLPQGAAK